MKTDILLYNLLPDNERGYYFPNLQDADNTIFLDNINKSVMFGKYSRDRYVELFKELLDDYVQRSMSAGGKKNYTIQEIQAFETKWKNDTNFLFKNKGKDNFVDILNDIHCMYVRYHTDTDTDTPEPQQIIIPDNILNQLEKKGLVTKEPLKWIGAKNLCAYFVCNYTSISSQINLWEIGEKLFKVKNLRQAKINYEGNSNYKIFPDKKGRPKNYEIIDGILEKT